MGSLSTENNSAIDCWNRRLVSWIVFIVLMIDSDPQHETKYFPEYLPSHTDLKVKLSFALMTDFLLQTGPKHQHTEYQRTTVPRFESLSAKKFHNIGLSQFTLSAVLKGN